MTPETISEPPEQLSDIPGTITYLPGSPSGPPELFPDYFSLSNKKLTKFQNLSPSVAKTLSLLRYGSGTLQTWSRHSAH